MSSRGYGNTGIDAADGITGTGGRDGRNGIAGEGGKDATDGTDGIDATDGIIEIDGIDETDGIGSRVVGAAGRRSNLSRTFHSYALYKPFY